MFEEFVRAPLAFKVFVLKKFDVWPYSRKGGNPQFAVNNNSFLLRGNYYETVDFHYESVKDTYY